MEDPLCDWEDARSPNEAQRMAESVKSDVESTLFQNFVTYEVVDHKEEEENDRKYTLMKVKVGDKNFLHLKILMPQTQERGSASLISAEEKQEQDPL